MNHTDLLTEALPYVTDNIDDPTNGPNGKARARILEKRMRAAIEGAPAPTITGEQLDALAYVLADYAEDFEDTRRLTLGEDDAKAVQDIIDTARAGIKAMYHTI